MSNNGKVHTAIVLNQVFNCSGSRTSAGSDLFRKFRCWIYQNFTIVGEYLKFDVVVFIDEIIFGINNGVRCLQKFCFFFLWSFKQNIASV